MKSGLTVEIRGYACFVNESKLSVPVKRWIAIEHPTMCWVPCIDLLLSSSRQLCAEERPTASYL